MMGFESSLLLDETAVGSDPLSKSQRTLGSLRARLATSPTSLTSPSSATSATSPTAIRRATSASRTERRTPAPSVSSQRASFVSEKLEITGEFVCDYDNSVSTLYSLLEASNWELAVTRAKTHPNEVRTWVVRRDKGTKDIRWQLLPIHASVIFQSPRHVVEVLLEKYPTAIQRQDDQGMIPLHLAFRHKKADEDLLQLLLVHHPKGVYRQDSRGRTPLELGRDGVFSAKFMSLYTSTCVALSSQTLTAEVGSVASKGYEKSLSASKSEYEAQIKRLTSIYEERIEMIGKTHETKLEQLQAKERKEKDALVHVHREEMQALHHVVSSTTETENHDRLNVEIQHLQSEVDRFKDESERLKAKMKNSNAFSLDFKDQIFGLSQEQTQLQILVERQQEELEAAQSMRTQLLKTLLQQEETDAPNLAKSSKEIHELMRSINTRIDTVAEKVTEGNDGPSGDRYQEYVQEDRIQDDDISAITEHSDY